MDLTSSDIENQSTHAGRVVMGRLGSRFGVQGWKYVTSFAASAADLFKYSVWQVQHGGVWQPMSVADYRSHGHGFVVKLVGCDSPEEARLYANNSIAILKTELPTLAEDYYWSDLIGLTVITTTGIELGVIDYLLETGSNDVMVIKPKTKEQRQHILPYTDDVVKTVNLAEQQMLVDWDSQF